jgi:hypothetical protein
MSPKRILLTAAAFSVVLIVFQSCYDATTYVIDNGPTVTKTVSFANDIQPIFNKSCSVPGCHNAGGKKPDLSSDKAYSSLTIGNYLNLAKPDQSEVYLWLTGKHTPQMPLGAAANPSSINQLTLAWIKQGAKNN